MGAKTSAAFIGGPSAKEKVWHMLTAGGSTAIRGLKGDYNDLGKEPADTSAEAAIAANEEAYNQYLDMIKSAVGGSGYDFFAPKTTTQTGHSETKATFGAEAQPLVTKLSSLYQDRLANPTGLPEGYLGTVARGTNDAYQGAQVAANNMAARRGLSGEQAVSIGEPIEAARAGKIADAANNMPLLGRQLQNEDMQAAQGFSDMLKGSVTDSRGSTTAPADIGEYLAYLGMLQPYQKPVLVPGAKTDNTGTYVGAAGSVVGAIIAAL
jgi:hypothetical protein